MNTCEHASAIVLFDSSDSPHNDGVSLMLCTWECQKLIWVKTDKNLGREITAEEAERYLRELYEVEVRP